MNDMFGRRLEIHDQVLAMFGNPSIMFVEGYAEDSNLLLVSDRPNGATTTLMPILAIRAKSIEEAYQILLGERSVLEYHLMAIRKLL